MVVFVAFMSVFNCRYFRAGQSGAVLYNVPLAAPVVMLSAAIDLTFCMYS